ncbi:hypothetical protein D7Y13_24670 [Corallococcus praedator]|uniref:Uncharacterized protein n=1 Tax=Corallococcus praedator TaxID=2316724 RepID=A0ABX9QDY8_9BACT|nr:MULTISPECIES: hypothetical protein [Corallococcus]RKH05546.1 hypothetical protein D7X74_34485 [Corallococcus sp. CA047B]RKH25210.1 hypothetical protein D7X75_30465 [Corallococcus sp. CA031C]RKI02419.1 hypothetical protein D7Y13_24670 [Corallococcus praedator]
MANRREWNFGAHHAHFEEPDLLVMKFNGPSKLEDCQKVLEVYQEVASTQPVFLISDVSNSLLEKEARELLVAHSKEEWFRGHIYVGTGARQLAGAKALMLALYFTGRWMVEVDFADSERDARDLVARKRALPPRH